MEVSIAAQTIVFFEAALLGIALSVVYDLIRVIRVQAHARRAKTAFFDAVFCLISGLSLFFFVVFAAKGEARGYIIVGAFLGTALYFMTVSKLILRLGFGIAKILSKVSYPVRRSVKKALGLLRSDARKRPAGTKSLIKLKKYFNFFRK